MKKEWLFPGAIVPVDVETTSALVAEIKRLIDVVGGMALAQQEPVAWMHTQLSDVAITHRPADLDRHPDRWTALYSEPKPCPTCEALARTVMFDQTSHDTSPPQRQWVGLTDAEAAKCWSTSAVKTWSAIEAKLKERNA
jgi:hypothetical protein